MLFIQHHFIRSHLAVVCNCATVSVETAQMIVNQYPTFSPQLVGTVKCRTLPAGVKLAQLQIK